jgi:predicted acylesterase/phospholipase RssA
LAFNTPLRRDAAWDDNKRAMVVADDTGRLELPPMSSDRTQPKTAFAFAGGGSFGAIQVGMLHALAAHGIAADVVFGSSVGALNGGYYAGMPTIEGIQQLEKIWRGLRRHDVFQVACEFNVRR